MHEVSLEQLELASIGVIVVVALLIAIALYNIANHQGGLGNALAALLVILSPAIPIILLSCSLLPFSAPIPSLTIVVVSFALSILLAIPTLYILFQYICQHKQWAIVVAVFTGAGILCCFSFLIVASTLPATSDHPKLY